MKFNLITIFPEIFNSYFSESIIKRAQNKKIISIKTHNLRDFTKDKHKKVDDKLFGGGAGMLLMIEPLYRALKKITKNFKKDKNRRVILLSAKGKTWDQAMAKKYTKYKELIFVCGRYEGVDERIKNFIDDEISIGDYVLTGGELGAMIIIDSITRLIPGVLGNNESSEDESHAEVGVLEYPQYTKPAMFIADKKKLKVPDLLLSGHHENIRKWREENKKKK